MKVGNVKRTVENFTHVFMPNIICIFLDFQKNKSYIK